MYLKYFIFSVIISFFPNTFVFAWSATGHGLVGDIAYSYLSPTAKSRVSFFLNGRNVHQSCTWMDSIKSLPQYSYLTPRHYININKGSTFDSTSTNNIVYELQRVIGELSQLKNLNDSMITQYVLEIYHLVGDIHQPLHCGYKIDAGGNSVRVNFLGQSTNLHSVWDYSLIQSGNVTLASCLAANQFTPLQIQQIQQIDVISWMNESIQLVDTCYYSQNTTNLDSNYMSTRLPVVQQQLLKAGLRLASIMEMLFGENSTLPLNVLSLNVQSSNIGNTLFWEPRLSKNVVRFVIEKSFDKLSFFKLGSVESNLNEPIPYYFMDSFIHSKSYYRLKVEYINGSTQYSSVIKVEWGGDEKNKINVSPNPAKSFLTARFINPDKKIVTIHLIGLDGKIYKTQSYPLNIGNVSVLFDVDGLDKGLFFLRVEGIGIQKVLIE